jgi:hypothetical protein
LAKKYLLRKIRKILKAGYEQYKAKGDLTVPLVRLQANGTDNRWARMGGQKTNDK